ncbi:MAG: enoyl-CoA hydratase/isomerase family protein [Solirubrobacteraceae bacterium]|nr:enoyl-CoA hydratase/isomerase family protein [Solirubrobacteraceae bacterium]
MPALQTVAIERRGAVATIELRRPDALNAWNREVSRDLTAALEEVAADDDIRAVGLTGEGRAFCSGADLKAGGPAEDAEPDLRASLVEQYNPVILGVRAMPKPVVSLVNGPAVGVGCSLALAGDIVVSADSAYFLLAFVNIGLVPDGGASAFVPARAGLARATEMAMLGERIPAPQALEWGLVNRVVPADQLAAEGAALLDRLAEGPTRAYAGIKRQFNAWAYPGLAEQLSLEADIQYEMGLTGDFAEGVTAFTERRPAQFSGR